MKRIGILGGTFDPPHIGHLVIADDVYHALNLDEIWFIPSQVPPHKQAARVSAAERLSMIEAAIQDTSYFKVNPIELERSGKSYTIDTIDVLKAMHPDITFYFIIGADMVEYLSHWHQIDQLVKSVQFVGVKRPEYQLQSTYPLIFVESVGIDLSSTIIRERIRNDKPIRYLLPTPVYQRIKERQLYEKT